MDGKGLFPNEMLKSEEPVKGGDPVAGLQHHGQAAGVVHDVPGQAGELDLFDSGPQRQVYQSTSYLTARGIQSRKGSRSQSTVGLSPLRMTPETKGRNSGQNPHCNKNKPCVPGTVLAYQN